MYKDQHKWIRLALMAVDGTVTACALILAGLWRYGALSPFLSLVDFAELEIIAVLSCLIAFFISKMYGDFFRRGYLRELQHVLFSSFLIILFMTLYSFATKNSMALSRLTLLYFGIIYLALTYGAHLVIKRIGLSRARGQHGWKLLVLTDRTSAAKTCRNILQSDVKSRVVGVILLNGQETDQSLLAGFPHIDPAIGCMEFIAHNAVDEVLVSLSETLYQSPDIQALFSGISKTGAVLSLKVAFPIMNEPREEAYVSRLSKINNLYVLSFANREYSYSMILFKRVMDIVGGLLGIGLTIVAGIFLAPAILLESRGPLLFRQKRVGRNGRIFTILKFRSMYQDAEERKAALMEKNKMKGPLFKMNNDPRITRVGKFIRKTSLDELPQFFNVLKGDMSLVGTRPPTLDEYKLYTNAQKKRLSFRPGLTGMWQVNGRNNITDFDEVMEMDLRYIEDWSIYLDIKLILRTFVIVLFGKGAQ